jgi:hypothetical protein
MTRRRFSVPTTFDRGVVGTLASEGGAAAMFALDSGSDDEPREVPDAGGTSADTFYPDNLQDTVDDFPLRATANPGFAADGSMACGSPSPNLRFSFETGATAGGWGTLEEEAMCTRRALLCHDRGRASYLACVPARPGRKGASVAEEFLFLATHILTEGKGWRSIWELTADPDDPWLLEGFRLRDAQNGEISRADILTDAGGGRPAFLSPAAASLRGDGTTLGDSLRAITASDVTWTESTLRPKSRDFLRGVAYFSTMDLDRLQGEEEDEWSRNCVVEVLARSSNEALVRTSKRGRKLRVAAALLEGEPVYSGKQTVVRRTFASSPFERPGRSCLGAYSKPLQSLGDAWMAAGTTRRIAACRCVSALARATAISSPDVVTTEKLSEEVPATAYSRALLARVALRDPAKAGLLLFSNVSVLPDGPESNRAMRDFFRAFFRASRKGRGHAPLVPSFQAWLGRFFVDNRRKAEQRYLSSASQGRHADAAMYLTELEGYEATAVGLARALEDEALSAMALEYLPLAYSATAHSGGRWCSSAVDEQLIILARGERLHLTFRGAWVHGVLAAEAPETLEDYVVGEIQAGLNRMEKHKDTRTRRLRDRLPLRAEEVPWRGGPPLREPPIAALAYFPDASPVEQCAQTKRKALPWSAGTAKACREEKRPRREYSLGSRERVEAPPRPPRPL